MTTTTSADLLTTLLWWFPNHHAAQTACQSIAEKLDANFREQPTFNSPIVRSITAVQEGRGWGIILTLTHPDLDLEEGQYLELCSLGTNVSREYTRDWALRVMQGETCVQEVLIPAGAIDVMTGCRVLAERQNHWKHFPTTPLLDLRNLVITMQGEAGEPQGPSVLTFYNRDTEHSITLPDLLIDTLLRERHIGHRGRCYYTF